MHIFAVREEDIDDIYGKIGFLHRHRAESAGDAYAIGYSLESANLLQEDDGTLHLACIYSTRYYRREAA